MRVSNVDSRRHRHTHVAGTMHAGSRAHTGRGRDMKHGRERGGGGGGKERNKGVQRAENLPGGDGGP